MAVMRVYKLSKHLFYGDEVCIQLIFLVNIKFSNHVSYCKTCTVESLHMGKCLDCLT